MFREEGRHEEGIEAMGEFTVTDSNGCSKCIGNREN